MEYFVPIFNFIGSACSILAYVRSGRAMESGGGISRFTRTVFLLNAILLFLVAFFGLFYFRTVSAEVHARAFYDRYKDTSFVNDFPDVKIRSVIADGMIILDDLNFSDKHPEIYSEILAKYKKANSAPFEKKAYIEIATDMFGALGSISGDLYKNPIKGRDY